MQDERKGGASAGKMEATTAGVGRLEEEALRRKERLKALREKTGRKDKEDGEPRTKHLREEEEEGEKHRELRLRNYVPEDEDLKKRRVPQAKPVAVEEKVKEQLEAAKPEPVIEEVDLANLAPRKPDWQRESGREGAVGREACVCLHLELEVGLYPCRLILGPLNTS
nr:coiled-coil domain-containing protein 12 isoform X2 [Macaca fascicularis]